MLQPSEVRRVALQHYLHWVAAAAGQQGASQLHHYFSVVRPECLSPDSYDRPLYIKAVLERHPLPHLDRAAHSRGGQRSATDCSEQCGDHRHSECAHIVPPQGSLAGPWTQPTLCLSCTPT